LAPPSAGPSPVAVAPEVMSLSLRDIWFLLVVVIHEVPACDRL
jgi:hypothetical protein